MTNSTTLAEKNEESSGNQQRADTVSDAFMVGIDREDRKHHFSRIRNAVTVLDADGEHEHTQSLGERSLKSWMAVIEQEHGGGTKNNTFSGSLADQLCDQLAAATGGSH
jgi:hypothetical protein